MRGRTAWSPTTLGKGVNVMDPDPLGSGGLVGGVGVGATEGEVEGVVETLALADGVTLADGATLLVGAVTDRMTFCFPVPDSKSYTSLYWPGDTVPSTSSQRLPSPSTVTLRCPTCTPPG